MVIAFCEDASIRLYETEAEAVSSWEGIDVENGVVRFFLEDGTYLAPRFVVPNRTGKYLWLIDWAISGTYVLEPAPGQSEDPLWLMLIEHPTVEPGCGIAGMADLKKHLVDRGAMVEEPTSR
jgi:hypothetical protein